MISRRLTWLIIGGAWLLTSLPHLIGIVLQPQRGDYLYPIQASAADGAAYYSDIEQARQGRLLFANQLTSESQQPSLFHLLWLVLGWLAWLTHISSPLVFQLGRLGAIMLLIFFLRRLLPKIFPHPPDQLLALIIVLTSSGLGWITASQVFAGAAILREPIDMWVAEANTFQSMMHSAQFVLAQVLLLLVVWTTFLRTQQQRFMLERWVGPSLLLLSIIHPYDTVTTVAVMLVWFVLWLALDAPGRQRIWATIRWMLLAWSWTLPALAYYILGPLRQPAVSGWFQQNITQMTTPRALLMGLGLLLPLAGVGLWRGQGRHQRANHFLIVWLVTSAVLCYLPGVPIARRFLGGIHLPLALLAAEGFLFLRSYFYPRLRNIGTICALLLLAVTNGKILQSDISEFVVPGYTDELLYVSPHYQQALFWLRNHSTIDDVVLASFWDSNTLAGEIARPVVFGHPNQTVRSWDREKDWTLFLTNTLSADQRRAMLSRLRVRWLFWTTTDEQKAAYQPQNDPRWKTDFHNDEVTIYRLQ